MTFKKYLDALSPKNRQYKQILNISGVILYLEDLEKEKEEVLIRYLDSIKSDNSLTLIPGIILLTLYTHDNQYSYVINTNSELSEEFMIIFDCHDRHS